MDEVKPAQGSVTECSDPAASDDVIVSLTPEKRSRSKLWTTIFHILRISLGIVFAILGVIGSFLPIMQGWIFFLLAALVLFPRSKFAMKALLKIEPRMPRLAARLRRYGIGLPPEDRDTIQL